MRWVSRILSLPRSDRHVLGADLNRSELEVAPVGSRAGQSSSVTGAGGRGWDLKTLTSYMSVFEYALVNVKAHIATLKEAVPDDASAHLVPMGCAYSPFYFASVSKFASRASRQRPSDPLRRMVSV